MDCKCCGALLEQAPKSTALGCPHGCSSENCFKDTTTPVASPAPSSRERTLERRADFDAGMQYVLDRASMVAVSPSAFDLGRKGIIARLYPLPPKVQPRVVPDPTPGFCQSWRCVDGRLQYRAIGEDWYDMRERLKGTTVGEGMCLFPMPERIAMWADLLANPTESVPDEE